MSKKIPTKLVVGILGIVVLLGGLYVFVFSGDSAGTSSSLQIASTTATGGSADGSGVDATGVDTDQVLRQLNELRRITISPEFFNSPAFLSLKDFGIVINPQEIGRDNPFIPSTYVPEGPSIVPRANPAVLEPINDGAGSSAETTDSASATTSTTTESAGN